MGQLNRRTNFHVFFYIDYVPLISTMNITLSNIIMDRDADITTFNWGSILPLTFKQFKDPDTIYWGIFLWKKKNPDG